MDRIKNFIGYGTAPPQPFSRSSDDIINQALKKIVFQKGEELKKAEQNQPKSKPQNLTKTGTLGLTQKARIDHQIFQQHNIGSIRPQHFGTEIERRHHPRRMQDMMDFHHQQYQHINSGSIKSMQRKLDRRIVQLAQQVLDSNSQSANQTITMLKMQIKNKYTDDYSMLKMEVKKQYEKFKKYSTIRDTQEFIDLLDCNLAKMKAKFEKKVDQFFFKCEEARKAITGKHQGKLDELEGKMKKISTNYFDLTRTNLIDVTIKERLPPFQGIDMKQYNQDKKLPLNEIVKDTADFSSKYGISFNQKSFSGLKESGWLHNSVIDNYIQYLRETRNYNSEKSDCAIFTSNQSKKFDNPESCKFNFGPIFTRFQKIGLVVNQNNDHWFFIGVYPKQNKVVIYDSIAKSSTKYSEYYQKIRNFIKKEEQTFKSPQSYEYRQIDEGTTMKQTNGADCGIHVVRNITHFLENKFEDADNKTIGFRTAENNQIRMAFYHFMAYLFAVARKEQPLRYDWLEYASRSAIIHQKKDALWKSVR